jgi:hypothetical protein
MPSFHYVPGQTYNMSVTVSQTGLSLFGVGVEALLSSGANAGTLTITDFNSTQIKSVTVAGNSRRNVVHTENGGASPDSKVFTFDWTAPPAGSGNITFYFSGVAANNNNNNNLDYVYNASQVFTESCLPPVQPGNISGVNSVCAGTTTTYSVTPVAGAVSYNWLLPSGWSGSSTTESITVTAGNTGDISVTAQNSCGTGTPSVLNVSVNPLPVVSINLQSVMNVDTLVSTPAASYQWILNGNPISGATSSFHVPLQNGDYTVEVSDANGCNALSPVYNYLTLSSDNIHNDQQIIFSIDRISKKVFITGKNLFNSMISVYDMQGRIILQDISAGDEIDISKLQDGVYIFSMMLNSERITEKMYIN